MTRGASVMASLESAAAHGADGLMPAARGIVAEALRALRRPDGGFAGLDGRSDAYFSFFAWLSLRALGADYDRDALCAYLAAQRKLGKRVSACCAEVVLLREGRRSRAAGWLTVAGSLMRGESVDPYGLFLSGLQIEALLRRGVPQWAARRAWRKLAVRDWTDLPTPQMAAGLTLASLAGKDDKGLLSALESRQCRSGGFVSAPGAPPDLLATAVARFSIGRRHPVIGKGTPPVKAQKGDETGRNDLSFIEACWQDDGLFGPFPSANQGDAENTFYGLLALGTCRQ
jgi:hypothetical protein